MDRMGRQTSGLQMQDIFVEQDPLFVLQVLQVSRSSVLFCKPGTKSVNTVLVAVTSSIIYDAGQGKVEHVIIETFHVFTS